MNKDILRFVDKAMARIKARPSAESGILVTGAFGMRCFRGSVFGAHYRGRREIWSDNMDFADHNLVVNAGLTYLVGSALINVTVDTTWFVGLTDNSPTPAAADTLALHSGWTEFTEYDETNRVAWTGVAGAAGVVTNTASPSVFTVNNSTNGGLGGAFLAAVNTGTSGTLFGVKALTGGNRVVVDNDVIEATYVLTATSS